MTKTHITTRILGLLALVLLLASCTTQTPTVVQPTRDLGVEGTASAKTQVVKMTLMAALNPSATAEGQAEAQPEQQVSTATLTPTAAEAEAATETPEASATPRQATANPALYPTRTPRLIPDDAVFTSFSPPDGTVYNPGNHFDALWRVKNTGTTTWTTDYHIRYARGANMSPAPRYYLKQEVKPGESVDLIADMVTPSEKGIQVGYWEFVNSNGDIIVRMYVAITVE